MSTAAQNTVASDHSAPPEQAEKVIEEVEKTEPVSLPPSKGGEEEKMKAEEIPSYTATSSELAETTEDKQTDPSLPEKVKKTVDASDSDVPVEDKLDVSGVPESVSDSTVEKHPQEQLGTEATDKQPEEAAKVGDIDEPSVLAESAESQPPELPKTENESVGKPPEEEPPVEVVDKQLKELPKIVDTPEPSVAADEKTEQVEALPMKESETVVEKDVESSEIESQRREETLEKQPEIVGTSEPADEVAYKTEEVEAVSVKGPETVVEKDVESSETDFKNEEETLENKPEIGGTPEPSVEAADKTEEVEVLPVKESEPVVVKDTEDPKVEPKKEEVPEPVLEAENKPQEQSEAAEQVEKESGEVKTEEDVKAELVGDREILADKIEDPQLKEEKTTEEEPVVAESSDQFTATNVEAQVDSKEDGGENPPPTVIEKTDADDGEKESSEPNVVEELSKEVVPQSGKVELGRDGKDIKNEENEGQKLESEKPDEPKENKVEDVSTPVPPSEVVEKSFEGGNTSRDFEVITENGKEPIKDETATPLATEKNGEVDEKVEEATTTTVEKTVEEPQKSKTEVKGEEAVQTGEPNSGKEEEAGDISKPDVPIPEPTKDSDDTIASREPPKEEVPLKPASKQSNTLMAKVKQSIVKAKKAIIGKSKTVSTDTKGEVKVK